MVTRRSWQAVLLPLAILTFGCRASPVSLAMMFVSDEVADADVARGEADPNERGVHARRFARDADIGSERESEAPTTRGSLNA